MTINPLRCLVALAAEKHPARAAETCGISRLELADAIRSIEDDFGQPILRRSRNFTGFTPQGEQVLAWAHTFVTECETLRRDLVASKNETAVAPLLERRSVSPKRLCGPGPNAEEIDLIVQAALRAPDHGGLHPWRVMEFQEDSREALAGIFEQEKLRRDPLASQADLRRAREHATRPPVLLAFIVAPVPRSKVPVREQWLSAGAALGNLLNATHQLGFGAIVLSGERCFDDHLMRDLGIKPEEFLAGFVSLGSITEAPPARANVLPGLVWSCWSPDSPANTHKPAARYRERDDLAR